MVTELLRKLVSGFEKLSSEMKILTLRLNLSILLKVEEKFKYFEFCCKTMTALIKVISQDNSNLSLSQYSMFLINMFSDDDKDSLNSETVQEKITEMRKTGIFEWVELENIQNLEEESEEEHEDFNEIDSLSYIVRQ